MTKLSRKKGKGKGHVLGGPSNESNNNRSRSSRAGSAAGSSNAPLTQLQRRLAAMNAAVRRSSNSGGTSQTYQKSMQEPVNVVASSRNPEDPVPPQRPVVQALAPGLANVGRAPRDRSQSVSTLTPPVTTASVPDFRPLDQGPPDDGDANHISINGDDLQSDSDDEFSLDDGLGDMTINNDGINDDPEMDRSEVHDSNTFVAADAHADPGQNAVDIVNSDNANGDELEESRQRNIRIALGIISDTSRDLHQETMTMIAFHREIFLQNPERYWEELARLDRINIQPLNLDALQRILEGGPAANDANNPDNAEHPCGDVAGADPSAEQGFPP